MCLVLRRFAGQSIVIGENAEIKVTIFKEEDGVVFVGIDAPKSIPVDRLERYEKKCVQDGQAIAKPIPQ